MQLLTGPNNLLPQHANSHSTACAGRLCCRLRRSEGNHSSGLCCSYLCVKASVPQRQHSAASRYLPVIPGSYILQDIMAFIQQVCLFPPFCYFGGNITCNSNDTTMKRKPSVSCSLSLRGETPQLHTARLATESINTGDADTCRTNFDTISRKIPTNADF